MVPVRKFSMTTSASFTSRLTTSTASGVFRSSAMPRLFRLKSRYAAASPSLWGGQVRDSSPGPVSSTLMTSAPRSGRSAPHQGPARTGEKSITRMPSSERAGLVMARTIPPLPVYIHPSANPSSGGRTMELYDVMQTTFSAREFTTDPLPDETLFKILDRARFAPSGGNRQGWRVIVVRDPKTREGLAAATVPAAKRYAAQVAVGESPWNTIDPTKVDAATIERTPAPPRLIEPVLKAPVILVVCVDLKVVASMDSELERVGVISGASIYPFAWNILLAARHEGFAGTITTLAVAQEPVLQKLLGLPPHVAVAAVNPLRPPVKALTQLTPKPGAGVPMPQRRGGAPLRSRPPARGLAAPA